MIWHWVLKVLCSDKRLREILKSWERKMGWKFNVWQMIFSVLYCICFQRESTCDMVWKTFRFTVKADFYNVFHWLTLFVFGLLPTKSAVQIWFCRYSLKEFQDFKIVCRNLVIVSHLISPSFDLLVTLDFIKQVSAFKKSWVA